MKLTKELVHGLAASLLAGTFDEPAPTPECHLEWWDLCCSDHMRVAIAAPRSHAKTTAITKCFGLASVLFRAHDFVLIVSDTYNQACLFLGELKRELQQNEDLIELFEIEEFLTDRENDIIVKMRDGHQFRIVALGSEQKVRGLLWNGKRPNLILGDDLENDEIVMNPDRREKFRNWVNNALLPCMSARGKIRIVGTILHMDAFLERLMPLDRSQNSLVSALSIRMKRPVDGWMTVRYSAHGPDGRFEEILWPVKWTEERLKEVQRVYKGQGNPEGYYQEYLNRPIDPHNAFFRREDFTDFSKDDAQLPFKHYPTYLSVDLAVSTKEKRDWSVFGIGSTDEQNMLYLRHILRERMDSKEIVDTILRLHDRYGFNTLLIGKGQIEKSIGPFLREALAKTGKFVHIEALPEVIDKRMRAQSIRARMRTGGVKFDKAKSWFGEFEQEMLRFDRDAHDDQVDMMSLFGMYLEKLRSAPTAKEIEEEEWQDENWKSFESELNQGRSTLTGY